MIDNITAATEHDEGENYEQKCLCVLVLDTSGSMNASGAINQLNDGLVAFKNNTMQDPVTRDRLEVAIVSFNSKIEVVQQYSSKYSNSNTTGKWPNSVGCRY